MGFPTTPYLCFVLSEHGYESTAFSLLFQRTCPSWLIEEIDGIHELSEAADCVTCLLGSGKYRFSYPWSRSTP